MNINEIKSAVANASEEFLKIKVDIIHGPLRDSDMLEIDTEIEIYAA